MIYLG